MNIKKIFLTVAGVGAGIAIMTIAPRSVRERELAKAKANINAKANAKSSKQSSQQTETPTVVTHAINLVPQRARWVEKPKPQKPQTKNRKVYQSPQIKNAHREALSELSVASLRKLATSRGIPVRLNGRVMNKNQLLERLTA